MISTFVISTGKGWILSIRTRFMFTKIMSGRVLRVLRHPNQSTFQGKAPPPPVAKGAGKVANLVGCWRNHGFFFTESRLEHHFFWDGKTSINNINNTSTIWKQTSIVEIGWCLFLVYWLLSLKLFLDNSCIFLKKFTFELLRSSVFFTRFHGIQMDPFRRLGISPNGGEK